MKLVRPRTVVHRGVVEAAGFLVEVELLGLPAARRRILSAWRPGTAVERLGPWLLLLPPAPVRVETRQAPGAPLVRRGGALLAAPFADDELDVLEPARDAVVAVRGGLARTWPVSERAPEEPARWLDVGAFEVAPVESLGLFPAFPTVVAVAPTPDVLRERLKDTILPPPPELQQVLAAIQKAQQTPARTAGRKPGAWVRLLEWLAGSRTRTAGASPAGPSAPARQGPSYLERMTARVQRLAARLLQLTRLSNLVGRSQAEYLGRMMDMFESGNLEQALRHAIPLGSGSAPPGTVRPALGIPSPRKDLSISPRHEGIAPVLGIGSGLMQELKQLYQQAFERLKKQGRIDEAAFVLAELLQANEEAVNFLEQHDRLKLAAELAESRGLPAARVVRLWFQAGNVERAVWIARRTGAFADAVARLELMDPEKARALRVLWAETLAAGGDFAAAVETLWPVEEGRRVALEWLDRAIALGGAAGVQALVRKLILLPSAFQEVKERAVELLEDDALEGARERRAFAEALLWQSGGSKDSPELRTLARPAVRALVRDRVQHGKGMTSGDLERLAAFSKDGALRTDLPPLPPPGHGTGREGTVLEVRIAAHDAGSLDLLDAVPLPAGRTLVALGELGARLITRDGRTVHHFDVPAHRLVVSDHGDRAFALASRGEAVELSRLDLLQRKASRWCTARVDAHAPDFDGSLWFVSVGDAVFAIDALAADFKALWRVDRLGGPVAAIARWAKQCHFVVDGRPPERWTLELPGLVLRERSLLLPASQREPPSWFRIGQSPKGGSGLLHRLDEGEGMFQAMVFRGPVRQDLLLTGSGPPRAPVLSGDWLAVPLDGPRGIEVLLLDIEAGSLAARFHLEGALEAQVRLCGPLLTVADDRGRLLVFDVEEQELLRDLRL